MNGISSKIGSYGIVPVIKIDNIENAVPLAKSLVDGGLPVAEVTFRTACAEQAIAAISKEYPDMLIGAGTVLTTEQVDRAIGAGAKFIVSPGLNPTVVKYCVDKNVPGYPGCTSPSDIEKAIELGLSTVKFFPAEQAGGIGFIKAISAPYSNITFMPTGGISEKNLNDYLSFDKIIACGGSWMVSADLINNKEFDKITELTKEAIQKMLGFEVGHVGINANSDNEATTAANSFDKLFGFKAKVGNSSIFSSAGIEIMKSKYLGDNGHIAIKTNYINRAVFYLKEMGFEFNEESAKYDDKNKLLAIYLKDQVAGFAIHLLQKK